MAKSMIVGGATANTVDFTTNSTTLFVNPYSHLRQWAAADEAKAQLKIYTAGTLRNMSTFVVSNSRTTTTTIKLRKNGADGAQSVTYTSGQTGWHTDSVNSDTFAANDLLSFSVTTLASGGTFSLSMTCLEFEATDGTTTTYWVYAYNDAVTETSAEISRHRPEGGQRPTIWGLSTVSSDQRTRIEVGCAATIRNARIVCTTMSMNINPTVTLYVNGVATAITVTLTGAGTFEDTTHTVDVAVLDTVEWRVDTTGRTAGSLAMRWAALEVRAKTAGFFDIFSDLRSEADPGLIGSTGGADRFRQLVGGTCNYTATEANEQMKFPFDCTLSRFRLTAINVDSGAATYPAVLRKNAADGNQNINVASGSTSFQRDTTHSDSVTAGDLLSMRQHTASGTSGLYWIGVTVSVAASAAPDPGGQVIFATAA